MHSETVTREVEVTTTEEQRFLTLTLSEDEAATLQATLRNIGGQPVGPDGEQTVRGWLTDVLGPELTDFLGKSYTLSWDGTKDESNYGRSRVFEAMYIPASTKVKVSHYGTRL